MPLTILGVRQNKESQSRVVIVQPGNTTGVITVGATLVSTAGTISHPAISSSSLVNQMRRTLFTSTAIAGNVIFERLATTECWRGNSDGFGGFYFTEIINLSTIVAGNRGFFGLVNTVANPGNLDPLADTTLARMGIGFNSNTGNWFIITSMNGVGITASDLGINFPINNTDVLKLELFCLPFTSEVTWIVTNLTTRNVSRGNFTGANVPNSTTFLSYVAWMTNNVTASAVAFNRNRMYLQMNY
jgi:hypothetical protein